MEMNYQKLFQICLSSKTPVPVGIFRYMSGHYLASDYFFAHVFYIQSTDKCLHLGNMSHIDKLANYGMMWALFATFKQVG